MTDALVIGSGPGGLSAVLTLAANNIDYVWLGKGSLSEKVRRAQQIRNYPGIPLASGQELAEAFSRQIELTGLTLTDEMVTGVYPMGGHYSALTDKGTYDCKTLILSVGVQSAKAIEGEERLLGRGVSYCAACDGMLYRGKTIAVIASSPDFEGEVEFLADLAAKVLFFPLYRDSAVGRPNTERLSSPPAAVLGDSFAEGIRLRDGSEIAVDGVFFLKDSFSPAVLLSGLKMDGEHIDVDRHMRTSLPGVFACGDCTGRPYQYAKAVGEGNVAAFGVLEYLRGQK